MAVKSRWPWITTIVAAGLAFNPIGLDVMHAALFSNEALSRDIWRPILLTGLVIVAVIGALEWRIRVSIINRRGGGSTDDLS